MPISSPTKENCEITSAKSAFPERAFFQSVNIEGMLLNVSEVTEVERDGNILFICTVVIIGKSRSSKKYFFNKCDQSKQGQKTKLN